MTKSPIILAGTTLLIAYVLHTTSAAPAPTPPPPRIESVTHQVRAPLRADDRITVSLRGTGGGAATFHIFGVVTNVGMRATGAGAYQALPVVYTGTYIVRLGDTFRNAAVLGTLTVRDTEVVGVAPIPVTIDTRPPHMTARHPGPQTRPPNVRPNIVVHLHDAETGLDPRSVRLVVNGVGVTARASVSESSVVYTPERPLDPGPVRVQLTAADRVGNTLRVEWAFQITAPDDLVNSVTITPATPLRTGDVLTVVMTGAPGGRASFVIEGLTGAVPMREAAVAGQYFGTYPVRGARSVLGARLLATLEVGGRRSTVAAAVPVTIVPTSPAAPTVTTPSRPIRADALPSRLIIGGETQPGFQVLGQITYHAQPRGAEDGILLGEFVTVAGPTGRWLTAITSPVPLDRPRLVLTVLAIDPAGQRSPPAEVVLTVP